VENRLSGSPKFFGKVTASLAGASAKSWEFTSFSSYVALSEGPSGAASLAADELAPPLSLLTGIISGGV
jgi:hypothetical protein